MARKSHRIDPPIRRRGGLRYQCDTIDAMLAPHYGVSHRVFDIGVGFRSVNRDDITHHRRTVEELVVATVAYEQFPSLSFIDRQRLEDIAPLREVCRPKNRTKIRVRARQRPDEPLEEFEVEAWRTTALVYLSETVRVARRRGDTIISTEARQINELFVVDNHDVVPPGHFSLAPDFIDGFFRDERDERGGGELFPKSIFDGFGRLSIRRLR